MILDFIKDNSTIVSFMILIISYIFIALEKIPKTTVAIIGAGVTLILGLVSQNKMNRDVLNPDYFINFIDFNVIFLLVSMMIIVNITTKSGVFNLVSYKLLKLTKGNPIAVFITLCIFTGFLSAFLDNVTTVILIMPTTFFIARKMNISPIPFLLGEIFASNIGGTSTLIGDPPNIIIGSAAGFSFLDFIKVLAPVITIILFTVILFLVFLFKKDLKTTKDKMKEAINIDSAKIITNKNLMFRSIFILSLVILGFLTHDITHIETCVTAMIGASILLLFEKPNDILKDVEWNTIFFFIGLFIIIGGVEVSGGIKLISEWILKITNGSINLASMLILWASGIISGIIDNIPYTATMSPMLVEIQKTMGSEYTLPLWWSLSLGACLGGNMTMIGAAANVIVSENAAKEGHKIGFLNFMKYGMAIVLISLVISTLYIYLLFLK